MINLIKSKVFYFNRYILEIEYYDYDIINIVVSLVDTWEKCELINFISKHTIICMFNDNGWFSEVTEMGLLINYLNIKYDVLQTFGGKRLPAEFDVEHDVLSQVDIISDYSPTTKLTNFISNLVRRCGFEDIADAIMNEMKMVKKANKN